MADENAKELIKRGDARFSRRAQLDNFRQELALNFAPWDAEWTDTLQWGEDFASHLIVNVPILLARDYVSQIGSMLRPPGKQYNWMRTGIEELDNDQGVRAYLDARSKATQRMVHNRKTGAARALVNDDRFFGLYGDSVLSVDTCDHYQSLRIDSYHTKDVTWVIGKDNRANTLTRKIEMSAANMAAKFGKDNLHKEVIKALDKDPETPFQVRHEVLPSEQYDQYKKRSAFKVSKGRFASVWIDASNNAVIRETETPTFRYVVQRSTVLPNTPYGMSIASVVALPDARLIQQQALAILEAAERQVDPPLIAADGDTIRGDPDLRRGKITWYDPSYDTRTGQPLMPIELGKNFQLGTEALLATEQQLTRAFHLDVLRMPDTRNTRSVEEVQFRIDEYVRAALPLFAPMQDERNAALYEEVNAVLDSLGKFPKHQMPGPLVEFIEGDDSFEYAWDNPLTDMMERQKAQTAQEIALLAQAIGGIEQAAAQTPSLKQIDPASMFRDGVMGLGGAKHLLDETNAEEEQAAIEEQQQVEQLVAAAPNVASIMDSGVNAAQAAADIPLQPGPGIPLLPSLEGV